MTRSRPHPVIRLERSGPGTVGGFSLSLPYVPGRLVIEVSGPAGDSGQLSGGVAEPAVTGGRLTLVRGGARTGGTWMEGAGG